MKMSQKSTLKDGEQDAALSCSMLCWKNKECKILRSHMVSQCNRVEYCPLFLILIRTNQLCAIFFIYSYVYIWNGNGMVIVFTTNPS